MEVDNPNADAAAAVRTAREELAAVIMSLTGVLSEVSHAGPTNDKAVKDKSANGNESEVAKKEREATESKASLTPVLDRLTSLRKSVDLAVAGHQKMVSNADEDENAVSPEDRAALEERHGTLVQEVRIKNEKIKILIDQLRELHRDIVILLASYFKHLPAQKRT